VTRRRGPTRRGWGDGRDQLGWDGGLPTKTCWVVLEKLLMVEMDQGRELGNGVRWKNPKRARSEGTQRELQGTRNRDLMRRAVVNGETQ
jgi:hypothetical protein